MIAVSALFPVAGAIDLGFTVKDIVEDKGSEAAQILRQRADELESALRKKS